MNIYMSKHIYMSMTLYDYYKKIKTENKWHFLL